MLKQEKNVLDHISDYQLLYDAYHADGGFKTGQYLLQHPREGEHKYRRRKRMSYYANYVKPVVDSHVDPIFREEPNRNWDSNQLFSMFHEDVDAAGTSMNRFMKKAALVAKLYAVAFIVIDNFADLPATVADTLNDRKLPYAYIVTPSQVTDHKVNRFGRLTSITYTEPAEDADGNITYGSNSRTWTMGEWILSDSNGKVIIRQKHSLARLPIVPLYSKPMESGNTLPQSEFYSISRTNMSLFNRCSELDEVLSNQAFGILTYPLGENQDTDEVQEIVTGTENLLGYDGTLSKSPEYIGPPAEPANMQMSQIDRLIQEIYRMAKQSHTTGVEAKASGVAKAYDFEKTNPVLADFAANCELAEVEMAKVFELWTSAKLNYTCSYERDFGIIDIEQVLKDADSALQLNIGRLFNKEVKKKVVAAYLGDIPEEDYDAVIEEIETSADDAMYAETIQTINTSNQVNSNDTTE